MPNKITLLLLFFLLSVLGVFAGGQKASALGQITEPIVVKSTMRGQSATAILTILNSESKEVMVDLKAEGQIGAWASFYEIADKKMVSPISQLKLPPKAYQDAAVKFEIPKDAPNGVYLGVVAVASLPETNASSTESRSSVSQRIDREVSITVSDKEIVAFDASVIPATYDLAEKEPLKIRIIYDNQGNISLSPQIQVKIKSNNQTLYNAIFPYPESETAVKPGSQQEIPALEIPTTSLALGKYQVEIDFLHNNESKSKKNFSFSIGQSLASGFNFSSIITAFKSGRWIIVLGVLVILAVLARIIIFKQTKKQKLI